MVSLSFSCWIWASFAAICAAIAVFASVMLENAERSATDAAAKLFTDSYRFSNVVSAGVSLCSVALYPVWNPASCAEI
jgi:hypothetical protein